MAGIHTCALFGFACVSAAGQGCRAASKGKERLVGEAGGGRRVWGCTPAGCSDGMHILPFPSKDQREPEACPPDCSMSTPMPRYI